MRTRISTWFLFLLTLGVLAPLVAAQETVDLNKASAEKLTTLPGVGPALAARIVEYRTKNGPFKRVEDLMNVRGIGEKTFLKMKSRLTVSGGAATAGKESTEKPGRAKKPGQHQR